MTVNGPAKNLQADLGVPIAFLGTATNLGLKPYDDGLPRRVREAPALYRRLGLLERLAARDLGDVSAGPYTDFVRPPAGTRHVRAVADYSRTLAERVSSVAGKEFLLLCGGDCSVLLGSLLGVRRKFRCGLVFIDGHADLSEPASSESGGLAGMDLAMAMGRSNLEVAHLMDEPLVRERDVVMLGRKDPEEDPRPGEAEDIPWERMREGSLTGIAEQVLERMTQPDLDGFWMHVDADVIDPQEMPAVDSPAPGGVSLDGLSELLRPLVSHPRALGLEVTIYDPGLDPEQTFGAALVEMLVRTLSVRK